MQGKQGLIWKEAIIFRKSLQEEQPAREEQFPCQKPSEKGIKNWFR